MRECGLDVRGDHALRLGIEVVQVIALGDLDVVVLVAGDDRVMRGQRHVLRGRVAAVAPRIARARKRHAEQPVVEPHFGRHRVDRRQPVDVALDLARVGAGRAAARVRVVRAMDDGHVAGGVLLGARAPDDVAVAQAHLGPRRQPEVALRGGLRVVVALDPQLARQRQRALAEFGLLRMIGREALLALPFGIVVDDELHRIEHGDAPLRARVEVVAHAVLEHAHVDPRVGLGHADALGEQPETLGREAAAARADQRRHPRVVPAVDVPVGRRSSISRRFDSTTYVRLSRANSYCCGSGRASMPPSASFSITQS